MQAIPYTYGHWFMSVVQSTRTFAEHTQVRGWAREAGSGTQQPQRHHQYNDTDNTNHNDRHWLQCQTVIIIVDIDHINYSSPLVEKVLTTHCRSPKYFNVYFKYTNVYFMYKERPFGSCRIIHTRGCAVRQPVGHPLRDGAKVPR